MLRCRLTEREHVIFSQLTISARRLALPFLATDCFSQQNIFEDELAVADWKWPTANAAGKFTISSLWPSLGFDPLIERVAIRALNMSWSHGADSRVPDSH